jgi:hypothetical protein
MTDVCRVGDNTLDKKTVLIVFVPGVMGSRLHFTDIGEFWNPNSKWDMMHWLRVSYERCADDLQQAMKTLITRILFGSEDP